MILCGMIIGDLYVYICIDLDMEEEMWRKFGPLKMVHLPSSLDILVHVHVISWCTTPPASLQISLILYDKGLQDNRI